MQVLHAVLQHQQGVVLKRSRRTLAVDDDGARAVEQIALFYVARRFQ
jgi:hypothetical protein